MWWLASWTEPQGQLKSQAEHLVSSSAFWISSCRACAFGTDWTWPLNPLHICRRLTWKTDSLMTWNPNHKQWLDTCGPLLQDYLHHKLTQWYIYILYQFEFYSNDMVSASGWNPINPQKKTLRMGILAWPSASFSAATPRRFSAVSCASKEATTMDSSDATWHQTCTYGSQCAIELPKTQNLHTCCSDCNSCWPQLTAYQRTTKQPSWNMVKPCENPYFRATGQSRNP